MEGPSTAFQKEAGQLNFEITEIVGTVGPKPAREQYA